MMRTVRALLTGVVASLAVVPSGVPRSEPAAGPETVAVLDVRAIGPHRTQLATGVVVGDGLVLTVAHALGDARTIQVDSRPACAIVVDRERDAAVLAVAGLRRSPVGLAESAAPGVAWMARRSGDSGSGRAAAAEVSPVDIRRHIVARVHEPLDAGPFERAALELEARVAAGDSGAPILDAHGRLVGMVFAGSRERDNRSYGVAVDELAPLVEVVRARSRTSLRGLTETPLTCATAVVAGHGREFFLPGSRP